MAKWLSPNGFAGKVHHLDAKVGGTYKERPLNDIRRAEPMERTMKNSVRDELGVPDVVDRSTFRAELDALRVREKAHTRAGDAIAAARLLAKLVEAEIPD